MTARRLTAKPDRSAPFAGVHPILYRSVMDAIERTVIVCDKAEREGVPLDEREVDYAGILCAAIDAALPVHPEGR